jgi:hypothetical protein
LQQITRFRAVGSLAFVRLKATSARLRPEAFRRILPATEAVVSESTSLIMIQFLAWVADRPRNYAQAMEAWRSTCPRLSVWEDAIIEGLARIENGADRAVTLTPRGYAVLEKAKVNAH